MKDIIPAKKQSPILGLTGLGGGVGSNIVAGGAEKVYGDDIFSTYVYEGNGTTRDINNGIDISGEGGLVWIKNRDNTNQNHLLFDTTSPPQTSSPFYSYPLLSNGNNARGPSANALKSFNTNGFSVYTDTGVNSNNQSMVSWTFRKQKGFFDIVKYTPSGGTNTISHNLGCVPGMILVKNLDNSENWAVFHRGTDPSNPNAYGLKLNETGVRFTGANWNVTSTTFDAAFSLNNNDGDEHIAYLFAGGESTAATARSVDFDGSGDYLSLASSSDFNFGTDDYTIECWIYVDAAGYNGLWTAGGGYNSGMSLVVDSNGKFNFYDASYLIQSANNVVSLGQWYHVAVSRSSNTVKLFVNGVEIGSATQGSIPQGAFHIGAEVADNGSSSPMNGKISNFRVVKGTAVYTSSFRPTYEPLTNITNTKLLCCNNSSVTGSTVTPGTITANGDPTASTDSPFDDIGGFKFGEGGDQNIIKCGYYIGNGSTDGTEVYLGWEPQWVMTKSVNNSIEKPWNINDVMRGFTDNGTSDDFSLFANSSASELGFGVGEPTPTGFKLRTSDRNWNWDATTYIYVAIRRSDGYVGKPTELGTGAFAMDTGAGSSTIPNYDSGFPVDFTLQNSPAAGNNWRLMTRLTGSSNIRTNDQTAESTYTAAGKFDSNVGYSEDADGSGSQSWMWKRHAGCDVVTWEGSNIQPGVFNHSLNKVPEMIWVRNRGGSDWEVYHKGLNGGSSPENYAIKLNESDAEGATWKWYYTAPTSINFTISKNAFNQSNTNNIAILFASIDSISKVDSYTAPTTPNEYLNIDCGFVPRFIIIKGANIAQDWTVFDTVRGLTSSAGNDPFLALNNNSAQISSEDCVELTSTGFRIREGWNIRTSQPGYRYIFYAHA